MRKIMKKGKWFKLIFKPFNTKQKSITAIAFNKEGLLNLIDILKMQGFPKKADGQLYITTNDKNYKIVKW